MGTELCSSVICKREVWEAGLHGTSLRKGRVGKDGVQVKPPKVLSAFPPDTS